MGANSLLSLSVVSHGQGDLVGLLLNDLRTCLTPSDEVILTINVPEKLQFGPNDFPYQMRVIENPAPRGFGANHNAAFRHSSGKLFGILNPDIRIESNPFPALCACLQADARLAACAPLIVAPSGAIEDSARRFPTPWVIVRKLFGRLTEPDYTLSEQVVYPDWIAGMFILFRREAFSAVQGFDEGYFLYYEDVDLSARLALARWRVAACTTARAVHDARRQSRRSVRYLRWHLSSMLRFFASRVYRQVRRVSRQAAP